MLIYVNVIVPLGLAHWLTFGLAVWADAQSSFLWLEHGWMVERKKHLLGLGSQFFSKKLTFPAVHTIFYRESPNISKSRLNPCCPSLFCVWHPQFCLLVKLQTCVASSAGFHNEVHKSHHKSPISSGRTDACGYGFGWKNPVPQNPVVYCHSPHSTSIQLCRNAICSEFPLVTSGNLCHGATGKSKHLPFLLRKIYGPNGP